ncbi:MAG: hypothetical protein Q9191_005229 [Dirinaria sp. TL-2023a]
MGLVDSFSEAKTTAPIFHRSIVEEHREDGYWIESFTLDPHDKFPGLIAYGLDRGEVKFFDNPGNHIESKDDAERKDAEWDTLPELSLSDSDVECGVDCHSKEYLGDSGEEDWLRPATGWPSFQIAKLDSPVAVFVVDVDGDGRDDIIICYDYGQDFIECNPDGGHIAWLANPGRSSKGELAEKAWTKRYIGRWPAMHLVHGPNDLSTPIPVILFQAPEKVLEATSWSRSIINDESFTVIHDACKKRFNSGSGKGLESLAIASREGLNLLHFTEGHWEKVLIHQGMPRQPGQEPQEQDFWGCESIDVGKYHDDAFAYFATVEAFHGTTVAAYVKVKTGLTGFEWQRYVLDIFGTPTQQLKQGKGPCHFVVTADFDNDGNDEFLVALWGPSPDEPGPTPGAECQGVWYYKPVDLPNGIFAKWKVASESAARIAVGDFRGDGRISFATISYSVANYYKSPHPQVQVYYNDFADSYATALNRRFKTSYWNNEALVCVPKPASADRCDVIGLLDLAGFRVELEVLRPRAWSSRSDCVDALKVIFGAVQVGDEENPRSPLSVPGFTSQSAATSNRPFRALEQGAVIIRLCRNVSAKSAYSNVNRIPIRPLLRVSPENGPQPQFKFTRVIEGKDFWSLKGFEIRFADQTPLAHVHFWTAGPKVDCGIHNHSDAIFGELHLSLYAGTGNGGMWWLPCNPTTVEDEFKPPKAKESDFARLPLRSLDEHGPMWYDKNCKTLRRADGTVRYPWHKWQAGDEAQEMDVWMAIELSPAWLD